MVFNIWIDDMRKPPHLDNLVYFKNAEAAIKWFESGEEILDADCFFLYLDHDLGNPTAATGYDFCKFFVEWNYDKKHTMNFMLLTQNPVGASNMRQLLTHYGYYEVRA